MQDRLAAMASVDLGNADTKFNPLVPSLFAAFTGIFIITVVAHRKRKSKEDTAQIVAEARMVYVRAHHARPRDFTSCAVKREIERRGS